MSIQINQNSGLDRNLTSIIEEQKGLKEKISGLKKQQNTITHIILSIITLGGLALIRQIKIMILEGRVIKLESQKSLIGAKIGSLAKTNEMIQFLKNEIEKISVDQAQTRETLATLLRHKKILLQSVDNCYNLYEMNNKHQCGSFNDLCDDLIKSFKMVINQKRFDDVKPLCERLIQYVEQKKKIA